MNPVTVREIAAETLALLSVQQRYFRERNAHIKRVLLADCKGKEAALRGKCEKILSGQTPVDLTLFEETDHVPKS